MRDAKQLRAGADVEQLCRAGLARAVFSSPVTAAFTAARTWRSCVTASTRPSDFARRARSVLPGQHHGHRLHRIDQARQPHRAAEAGMQAEQHFGKAEAARLRWRCGSRRRARVRARRRGNSRGSPRRSAAAGGRADRAPRGRASAAPRSAAASVTPRNSPMSAPAMKPPGLAERITRPRGRSRSILCQHGVEFGEHVFGQACWRWRPACRAAARRCRPRRVRSRQCCHGPALCAAPRARTGPSSRSRGSRMSKRARCRSVMRALHRLDQHGAALAAADAFGGDAALEAEPLHGVDEMQHDAVAARADRMAERRSRRRRR